MIPAKRAALHRGSTAAGGEGVTREVTDPAVEVDSPRAALGREREFSIAPSLYRHAVHRYSRVTLLAVVFVLAGAVPEEQRPGMVVAGQAPTHTGGSLARSLC